MAQQKSRVPRPTKADLAALRKNAAMAEQELDKEQETSVLSLAEALGEIGEGEALAHIDTRLAFLERQVERLTARREEADRGFQGELNVMRARLEDALEAVTKTVEDQRSVVMNLEARLADRLSSGEGRASETMTKVRAELTALIHDATTALEKNEARVRGEIKAMEETIDERVRNASTSIGGLSEELEASSRATEATLSEIETRLSESLESEGRELDARLSEGLADLRLEIHSLRQDIEAMDARDREMVGSVRNDAFERIRSSEEKAASAAIHLESMIVQLRKQMAGDEQEFSATASSLGEDLTGVKVRLEEVASRLDSAETKRSGDRTSAEAAVSALSTKVSTIEARLGEIVEEIVAKHATRMEVLASQVANIHQSDVAAEERSGAVDYLSRRLAETGERLDELMNKVNTLARSSGMPKVEPLVPPQVEERISVLESRMAAFASKPRQDAYLQTMAARLDSIERRFAQDRSQEPVDSEKVEQRIARLEQMLSSIPETLAARQSELLIRLNEIEKKLSLTPTILPDKKKRGLWN